ncbi:hypothetical protein D3C71_1736190 [compost metagenome]
MQTIGSILLAPIPNLPHLEGVCKHNYRPCTAIMDFLEATICRSMEMPGGYLEAIGV